MIRGDDLHDATVKQSADDEPVANAVRRRPTTKYLAQAVIVRWAL